MKQGTCLFRNNINEKNNRIRKKSYLKDTKSYYAKPSIQYFFRHNLSSATPAAEDVSYNIMQPHLLPNIENPTQVQTRIDWNCLLPRSAHRLTKFDRDVRPDVVDLFPWPFSIGNRCHQRGNMNTMPGRTTDTSMLCLVAEVWEARTSGCVLRAYVCGVDMFTSVCLFVGWANLLCLRFVIQTQTNARMKVKGTLAIPACSASTKKAGTRVSAEVLTLVIRVSNVCVSNFYVRE